MKSLFVIFFCCFSLKSYTQIVTIGYYGRFERLDSKSPGAPVERIKQSHQTAIEPPVKRYFYNPLKNIAITSPYGWRNHPVTSDWKFHTGVDLKAWYEPVFAVADGIVTYAGWSNLEGNYIAINHGGIASIYCHLSKLNVVTSEIVTGGQVLGISGNTGRSTGPHLHFGLRGQNIRFDPKKFLEAINK